MLSFRKFCLIVGFVFLLISFLSWSAQAYSYTIIENKEISYNNFYLNVTTDYPVQTLKDYINSSKSANIVIDSWGKNGSFFWAYGHLKNYQIAKNKLFNPYWNASYFETPLQINNTGNSSILTNFTVKLNITYNSTTMDANFTSFHFVNKTSNIENINRFWIDRNASVNGSYAIMWLNLSFIPASAWDNTTNALYHRNVTETDSSNGSGTFIRFGMNQTWINGKGTWTNENGYRKQTSLVAADPKLTYINISELSFVVHSRFRAFGSVGANTRQGIATERPANNDSAMIGTIEGSAITSAVLIPGTGWFGSATLGFTIVADQYYNIDMLRQPNVQKVRISPNKTDTTWKTQTTQASTTNTIAGLVGGYDTEVWFDEYWVYKAVMAGTDPTAQLGTTISAQVINISNWQNNYTNNQSLNFTISKNTSQIVNFNVSTNITSDIYSWFVNGSNQSNNFNNFSYNFSVNATVFINATVFNASYDNYDNKNWTVTYVYTPDAPPPPALNYSVSGYVKIEDGTPLEDATVSYSGGSNLSNATGLYNITGIVNGTYLFTAARGGYNSLSKNITISGANLFNQNFTLIVSSNNTDVLNAIANLNTTMQNKVNDAAGIGFIGGIVGGALVIGVLRRKRS